MSFGRLHARAVQIQAHLCAGLLSFQNMVLSTVMIRMLLGCCRDKPQNNRCSMKVT